MTKRKVIFPDPDIWTTKRKDTPMTEKKITEYTAPEGGVIEVIPGRIDFFYCKPQGKECVGIMLNDEKLGPIAVLLTPECAQQMAASLASMSMIDLNRLRDEHHDKFGGEAE